MPIYEYTCKSCGHQMEAMQKMSDAPLSECPACGKPKLEKMISAAGFRLKGEGWSGTTRSAAEPSAPPAGCGGGGCGCAAAKGS